MCGGGWESFLTWLVHSSNSTRFYESISQDLEDKDYGNIPSPSKSGSSLLTPPSSSAFALEKPGKKPMRALCLPPRGKIDCNPRTHGFGLSKVTAMDFRRPGNTTWNISVQHNLKYFCTLLQPAENRLYWAHSLPSHKGWKAFEGLNEVHHFSGTLFPLKECFQTGMDMTPAPYPHPALRLTLHALRNKTLNHFPLVTEFFNAFSFLKKTPGFWQFSLK